MPPDPHVSAQEKWRRRDKLLAVAAAAFVLVLHGAVPFFMMPAVGQAMWAMGFSQSLAHGPLYGVYAHDFGIPKPAAIAFGLAGVWPASVLIRSGLHPADAYSGMVAFWLLVAFFCAYRIGHRLGATRPAALAGGMAWISMPVIWGHAGYTMLSLGIALLPFYFLAALHLFLFASQTGKVTVSAVALYFVAAVIAVFMDGYTFVMFATGSSMLFLFLVLSRPELRSTLLRIALPVHAASFAVAYALYVAYIGKADFDGASMDFFRGFGVDLSFLAIPTRGVHWLPDLLGASWKRTDETYFGDFSVWSTTFSLPVIVAGLVAWISARSRGIRLATGAVLIAAFGFYMALGPSLKVDSTKPESLQLRLPGWQSTLMPAAFAVMPTGSAWISENVPGFKNMRAAYRWSALGIFALWLGIMICVGGSDHRSRTRWVAALLALVALNLPLPDHWAIAADAHAMFKQIDDDLVPALRRQIREGETVAFIPWGNDFAASYLASRGGFRTFNIGGDKNLADAQKQWPPEMLQLGGGELGPGQAAHALKMLTDGTADALIVPYFDMLWSLFAWPCLAETNATVSRDRIDYARYGSGIPCPSERRQHLSSFIETLKASPYLEVADSPFFSRIRLRPEYAGSANREKLLGALRATFPTR